jgi:inhibitor of cysteine peptidase
MNDFLKSPVEGKVAISILIAVSVVVFFGLYAAFQGFDDLVPPVPLRFSGGTTPFLGGVVGNVRQFSSEAEFVSYMDEVSNLDPYGGFFGGIGVRQSLGAFDERSTTIEIESSESSAPAAVGGAAPDRVSGTNVQVAGIDEPDILKTDGNKIYFSGTSFRVVPFPRSLPLIESIAPYPSYSGVTRVVNAFPPEDLALDADIELSGDLLLVGDTLVVFSGTDILGYDVSDPTAPQKQWVNSLGSGTQLVQARLYDGKIYLVTQDYVDIGQPCPIRPLVAGGVPISIPCASIYHPVRPVPTDVTFTAMTMNPSSGGIEETTSFTGSSQSSVVYMSPNALYVTYSYSENSVLFFAGFVAENTDLFPSWFTQKIVQLAALDLSEQAKVVELTILIERFQRGLDDDERLRVENEMEDRMKDYYDAHKRELETTGIMKLELDGLSIDGTGAVPGYPLNQFALDEYKGNLRVAVTIGERSRFVFGAIGESANDVYVLGGDLSVRGSVKDLGLTERIYSVRFVGDMGYVVTFRQTDPFYVLDLSRPDKPTVEGELKIPGYSSYLHPITDGRVVGIGKEGSKVKISLFDVADPKKPTEPDKYLLDEFWSDVLKTHHAFLHDAKHGVFFMPGSKGGYVFSYGDDDLQLVKAISSNAVRRALFINDYLYIVGDEGITVLNENDWEKVSSLEF